MLTRSPKSLLGRWRGQETVESALHHWDARKEVLERAGRRKYAPREGPLGTLGRPEQRGECSPLLSGGLPKPAVNYPDTNFYSRETSRTLRQHFVAIFNLHKSVRTLWH